MSADKPRDKMIDWTNEKHIVTVHKWTKIIYIILYLLGRKKKAAYMQGTVYKCVHYTDKQPAASI